MCSQRQSTTLSLLSFLRPASSNNSMSIFRWSGSSKTSEASSVTLEETDVEDTMVEIDGKPMDEHDGNNNKSLRERIGFNWQHWIITHQMEVLGMLLVLFGSIIVLGSLGLGRGSKQPSENVVQADSQTSPTQSFPWPPKDPQPPVSAPTAMNVPGAPSPTFAVPTVAEVPRAPIYPSIHARLSELVDSSLLRDPTTPQGRAYDWIAQADDLRWHADHPSLVQRFALAAFYFASGGGRTSATWNVCSAVPSKLTQKRNAFTTRCVWDEGRTICAAFEAFQECPEYYEKFNMATPENPKKRWLSAASECDWYGVLCNDNGRIEQINLPANGLQGSLIVEMELLSDLTTLNLGENDLRGELPAWGKLDLLEHVLFYENALEGSIPASWRSMTELKTLDLAKNSLKGSLILPGGWLRLRQLTLSDTGLDIALRPRIGLLEQMELLDLSGNSMIEQVPGSIGKMKKLTELNLANCQIEGQLPNEIDQLTNLVELQLQENFFYGTLPNGLWDMTHLQVLRLEANQFTGTLSSSIGQLVALQELSVERSGLSGELPATLANLVSLERAHLQFNDFTGVVPRGLCELDTLVELWADCDGPAKVECRCCTRCCSWKKDKCRAP